MEAAHDTTFFKVLLIVLGATAIVIPLVQQLRLPPVVGYMAVGMAVGPFGVGTLVADIPFLAALVIDDHAAAQIDESRVRIAYAVPFVQHRVAVVAHLL